MRLFRGYFAKDTIYLINFIDGTKRGDGSPIHPLENLRGKDTNLAQHYHNSSLQLS